MIIGLHSGSEGFWLRPGILVTLGSNKYQTLINIGLVTLPLDAGAKLAVGQWIACWSGLPGGSSSRGKLSMLPCHICYIYRTWKSISAEGGGGRFWFYYMRVGQAIKEWDHFYGGNWTPKTPSKYFNLAIVGLGWIKWVKMGQEKVYISCNYSCPISFLVKILLVKLK